MRQQGAVINFNAGRGFGFILPDGQRISIFAHIRDVRNRLLLRAEDRVEFEIVTSDKGGRAVDILLLTAATGGAR